MNGFAAEWLQRREPFDAAARDADLARRFGAALVRQAGKPRRIVDLAAGSGANFRLLAPLLGGDQDWLMIDHDDALIAAQAPAIARWATQQGWQSEHDDGAVLVQAGAARWRARPHKLDLAQQLAHVEFAACDGVTTTAFLDLVSSAWLERLCELLARNRRPLLATLTVDGRRNWQPPLPADARIDAAFRRHQCGDKGFGPAHGSLATAHLAECFAARGYDVTTARSDWQIGAAHRDMLLHLAGEAAAVATATEPAAAAEFTQWLAQRRTQIEAGQLTLEVGHFDLLAVAAPLSA